MGTNYTKHIGDTGGYLVSHAVRESFQEAWFDPVFWGEQAVIVTKGGRGAAWFVHAPCGELVLRHFCRGGLPGRYIRRAYVFTHTDAVRSLAEFRLLNKLLKKGLPVPEPIAAGYCLRGPLLYHASLIIRRIPDAVPLSECVRDVSSGETWHAAGACVRRFHNAGVFHADLNCMNILVADQVYLIDFDRGRMMPEQAADGWKAKNISRLERSVKKCLEQLGAEERTQLWQDFLAGYLGG
ncbi:3-deoxy-D-manno-octulosonic acid kinase [Marinobacter sp. LV10R510-11A]|uniref:3-deoxy-D-manno-octulosonic acid kinase n=1 Tax=Marinobacter sp. LV10R510-11A TaxID=1415568 RepID=UPI000BB7CB7C|nr:3-deoxy-D-manno-octulosonic acid kinase [Marinobacter sp. LV10R510-11A]SOB76696.1 3-deoxy-D-manno-octulosonic acid kinase [Marinobacter sp. LV10R510-11A]